MLDFALPIAKNSLGERSTGLNGAVGKSQQCMDLNFCKCSRAEERSEEMKEENPTFKLGGILAIAIGFLYLLLGVTFLLSPTDGVQDYKVVLPSFADSPATTVLYGLEAALIGLLALGLVPEFSKFVGSDKSALLKWVMYLGMLGFAVEAVDQLRSLNILPLLTDFYVSGNEGAKTAVLANQSLRWIDTTCFFRFGLPGLWILVVSIAALISRKLNKILCVLGMVGAAFLWLAMIGNLLQATTTMAIGAGAAIVVGPVW